MLSAPETSVASAPGVYDGFAVTHYVSALRTANAFTVPYSRLTAAIPLAADAPQWPARAPAAHTGPPRKCIIYLEPRRTTPLYAAIERFFALSSQRFGPTEAHMYHPHSSMTGFIELPPEGGAELVARIAAHLDALITPALLPLPTLVAVNTARDYPHQGTHKIEAKLDTPAVFRDIVGTMQKLVPEARIRPKKIGHVSLAYYNKHVRTENRIDENAADIHALAHALLDPLIGRQDGNQWDIAFYELALESTALHIPHRFNEIARWHL
ncbi:hypothetical protein GGI24_001908 [Coemansia furcata]|nr:hypothetical protein GGI24_001908 [Coemansia furcata]